jgi:hypothetical protein
MPVEQAIALGIVALDHLVRDGRDDKDHSCLRAMRTLERVDRTQLRELEGRQGGE